MTMEANMQPEDRTLPEWIRILPLGRVELVDRREPLTVDRTSLDALVADFRSRGVDLVIDYEHQSLQGERAPAAGWIKELEGRSDGLWGRVEWTPQAREYLKNREYRYFSPVLRLDPESRKPTVLMHLGLTNVPAIKSLPPLVAKAGGASLTAAGGHFGGEEETDAMERLKRLLGLPEEAGPEEAGRQVLGVLGELAAILDLPEEAPLIQLPGSVAALKAASEKWGQTREELEALKLRLADEAAARVVEEALKSGKVTPAQRGWALEYHRRDPQGFQTYLAGASKVVPTGEELELLRETQPEGLLPEELALCRCLNLAPGEYLKAKAQIG
jgi:phage I-like protein